MNFSGVAEQSRRPVRRWVFIMVAMAFTTGCATPLLAEFEAAVTPSGADLVEKEPWRAIYLVAQSAEKRGDFATAKTFYAKSLSKKPDFEDAFEALSRLAVSTDDEVLRMAVLRYKMEIKSPSRLMRRQYARALLAQGFADEAVNQLSLLLSEGGTNDDRARLALALDHVRQHDAAQEFYKSIIAEGPVSAWVINNYGLSLALSGQKPKAVVVLQAAVTDPSHEGQDGMDQVRSNLAVLTALGGDRKKALEILDRPEEALNGAMETYQQLERAILEGAFARPGFPTLRNSGFGA